jgi:CRISPR-associated exonuclease Cas4
MHFNVDEFKITGTYIWYYFICKREVWLLSRGITADQQDDNMSIGRLLHENTYMREKKELDFYGMKLDIIKKEKGRLLIGEIKKSSKYLLSAKMQLLFYLSELEEQGLEAEGVLLIPEERKRENIILNENSREAIRKTKNEILDIVSKDIPPIPEKINYCKKCAYNELCWS